MKQFDILYARNSNGKINEWSIRVENIVSSTTSNIVVSEGLIDGQKTKTNRIAKPKNVGKMNETSSYQQACNEAESRWEKKKKQGYKSLDDLGIPKDFQNLANGDTDDLLEQFLPKNRTDANDISKPMRAQQYYKFKTVNGEKIKTNEPLIKFPCYGQPKLNGFRVMARWEKVIEGEGIFATEVEKVVFRSKEGLRYDILEHIENEMTEEMFRPSDDSPERALDGEMYIHGEILSEISSAVRKRNSKTPLLKFCIFDCAVEGIKQIERIEDINLLADFIEANGLDNLSVVLTHTILDNSHAQFFTNECIKMGYEGAIFRDMKAFYQFGKRPQTMTKLKRSDDKEFKIVDVVAGDNSPELGVFVCIQEQGLEFKVTPEGSHEIKKEYLNNKATYIGKMLTVKFFERTKDNKPFHATGLAIRDYE